MSRLGSVPIVRSAFLVVSPFIAGAAGTQSSIPRDAHLKGKWSPVTPWPVIGIHVRSALRRASRRTFCGSRFGAQRRRERHAPSTGTGLTGRYYNDPGTCTRFTTLMRTRTDATVNFDRLSGSPVLGVVQTNNFSVRWTGQVQAPVTGNYTFSTVSDDGVRFWINGVLRINNWTDHAPTTNTSAPVALIAGTKYSVVMEYYERGGGAEARLRWAYPGRSTQVIPKSRLFP